MPRPTARAARGCARARAGAGAGWRVPGRAPVGRRGDADRRCGVDDGAGRARGDGGDDRRDHGARGRQAAAAHRRAHAHRARRHSARGAADGRMGHRRRRQPVGHVSRAAAQHAGDAAGGGGRRAAGASACSPTPTSGWCACGRTTARRWRQMLDESKRLGAIGLKIPKGLGLGYPTADRRHLLAGRRPRARPAVREGGRAGHADRDPHRRSQGVLEAGDARQRTLGRAAGAPRVVVLRRAGAVVGAALRRVRATRRAAPEEPLHRRALRQRPGGSGARREDARQVSQLLHRHRGARARDRAAPRSIGCGGSTRSTRTASCSAPTPAWARARTT